MSQWECEECGATAPDAQRKNCIQDACDQRCKWIPNPTSHEDDDQDEENPENRR